MSTDRYVHPSVLSKIHTFLQSNASARFGTVSKACKALVKHNHSVSKMTLEDFVTMLQRKLPVGVQVLSGLYVEDNKQLLGLQSTGTRQWYHDYDPSLQCKYVVDGYIGFWWRFHDKSHQTQRIILPKNGTYAQYVKLIDSVVNIADIIKPDEKNLRLSPTKRDILNMWPSKFKSASRPKNSSKSKTNVARRVTTGH